MTINRQDPQALLGDSPEMQSLQLDIEAAALSAAKVLLTGETGVGKEVVARLIHEQSARRARPYVTINCAGVPDSLLESELFGHARGSFTDAYRDNPGRLRQAHLGTVFLDEVGEMSLRMQAMLLRFLESGEIETVGGSGPRVPTDVRVIAATNRDLAAGVENGDFRRDLYYRLNVLHLHIPPLRNRAADIEMLMRHFLARYARQHSRPVPDLAPRAVTSLVAYPWPGNVRELRNLAERLVLRVADPVIAVDDLERALVQAPAAETNAIISRPATIEELRQRMMVGRESFWTTAYTMFQSRDITRDDIRYLIQCGLQETRGSYRLLVELFNMPGDDYKRFLAFLKQHDCHLPFQQFRRADAASLQGSD